MSEIDNIPLDCWDDFNDSRQYEPRIIEYTFVVSESPKAWLLTTKHKGNIWFPKSKCELNKDTFTVSIPEWLAIKKNL